MSVWSQIDSMLAEQKQALASLKEQVKVLGGGDVRVDALAWWRCTYRPTSGNRQVVKLQARSPGELLELLRRAVGK